MDAISALMDGELGADEARRQFARLKEDQALRVRWDEFHLIGDAMRGETPLSPQFDQILSRRLAAEPTVFAPRRFPSRTKRLMTYAMSAAAAAAGIAFVGWMALGPNGIATGDTMIANGGTPQNPLPVTVASPAPIAPEANLPSEGRMNEYLLAHQGFSPSTAIQGLAPYIRSVSITGR